MDFGEVVTTSSRAFWTDYEEFETAQASDESISLDYGTHTAEAVSTLLASVDTVLVLEGAVIQDFVHEAVLRQSAELLCTVIRHKCAVYQLNDKKTAVVLLSGEHDLMSFGRITEKLMGTLLGRVPRVITINVEPSVSYKTAAPEADTAKPCFLRGLTHSKGTLASTVLPLAEPNLLTGVAAGVASWRKFTDQPWSSYVAYISEPEMNSLTTAPILRLLQELDVACAPAYAAKQSNESNLYT